MPKAMDIQATYLVIRYWNDISPVCVSFGTLGAGSNCKLIVRLRSYARVRNGFPRLGDMRKPQRLVVKGREYRKKVLGGGRLVCNLGYTGLKGSPLDLRVIRSAVLEDVYFVLLEESDLPWSAVWGV